MCVVWSDRMLALYFEVDSYFFFFFFFQAEDGIRDLTVTGVQTCLFRSITPGRLTKALRGQSRPALWATGTIGAPLATASQAPPTWYSRLSPGRDRKSTRLNSSHRQISYAVFCLKEKRGADVGGGEGAAQGDLREQ